MIGSDALRARADAIVERLRRDASARDDPAIVDGVSALCADGYISESSLFDLGCTQERRSALQRAVVVAAYSEGERDVRDFYVSAAIACALAYEIGEQPSVLFADVGSLLKADCERALAQVSSRDRASLLRDFLLCREETPDGNVSFEIDRT